MSSPLYKPPVGGTRREIPLRALVSKVDPDFERRKHHEIEYVFNRRMFFADPDVRGAYNNFSNSYPVGQPHGPLIKFEADSVIFRADLTHEIEGAEATADAE